MATAKPVQSAHTRDTNEKLANLDNTTKETVQRIDKVNNKITDLREQRMRDPTRWETRHSNWHSPH